MYYSQPLRPPCVNTHTDNKSTVSSFIPAQKRSTTSRKKPSTLKVVDAPTTRADAYTGKDVRVPGKKYTGTILDRENNSYTITGVMDASSKSNGGFDYSYTISIMPLGMHVHSIEDDIIRDLQNGCYLEDFVAKHVSKVWCDGSNEAASKLKERARMMNITP